MCALIHSLHIYIYTDVAQLVLKKCTSTNAKEGTVTPDSSNYAVTFNYEFLDDSENVQE